MPATTSAGTGNFARGMGAKLRTLSGVCAGSSTSDGATSKAAATRPGLLRVAQCAASAQDRLWQMRIAGRVPPAMAVSRFFSQASRFGLSQSSCSTRVALRNDRHQ